MLCRTCAAAAVCDFQQDGCQQDDSNDDEQRRCRCAVPAELDALQPGAVQPLLHAASPHAMRVP